MPADNPQQSGGSSSASMKVAGGAMKMKSRSASRSKNRDSSNSSRQQNMKKASSSASSSMKTTTKKSSNKSMKAHKVAKDHDRTSQASSLGRRSSSSSSKRAAGRGRHDSYDGDVDDDEDMLDDDEDDLRRASSEEDYLSDIPEEDLDSEDDLAASGGAAGVSGKGPMAWRDCLQEARKQLGFQGQKVPIGGPTSDGQKLLKLAKEMYAANKSDIIVRRKKPTRDCPWRPGRPRDRLVDLRDFVDYGKSQVSVTEEPSFYPGVTFKNGNTFKQIRANKEPRDLDSWMVNWARRDENDRPVRDYRHFYVGQFYTKDDRDYERAKERARQFAIEFRKEKVREMDATRLRLDRQSYDKLAAEGQLEKYRPPKNRVAIRQSGCQGVTWSISSMDWQVQMRMWDPALKKSRVIKQAHVKLDIPPTATQEDEELIENCIENARIKAVAIRKEWERRYRTYTVKHYAKYPKYDENGKLIEDEYEDFVWEGTPLTQYGTPVGDYETGSTSVGGASSIFSGRGAGSSIISGGNLSSVGVGRNYTSGRGFQNDTLSARSSQISTGGLTWGTSGTSGGVSSVAPSIGSGRTTSGGNTTPGNNMNG